MVVSDVAGLLGGLVTNLTPLVVIGFALVPLSYYLLWRTRFGLRLRSCGENPVAAESLGVDVYRYKYIGVVVSGALAGLGGAALVLNPGQLGYLEGQTGGRGYIGLAAMIFGNWRPGGLLARLGAVRLRGRAAAARRRPGGARAALHRHAARRGRRAVLGGPAALGARGRSRPWPGRSCYALYFAIDTVPREFAAYAPQLVTLVVLAVAVAAPATARGGGRGVPQGRR